MWYNVPVLNISRSIGYEYKHGSWDKYVFKTIKAFMNYINSMTVEHNFELNYRKKYYNIQNMCLPKIQNKPQESNDKQEEKAINYLK